MKTKPNLGLNKKIQVLVTEEDWLKINKKLNKLIKQDIIDGRTSFSAYIRSIILNDLNNE